MSKRSALLLGATGLIGSLCLERLLNNPQYKKVVILVRRTTGLNHEKLDEQVVDFNRLQDPQYQALFAVDDVFCALGTTIKTAGSKEAFRKVDYDYPLQAAAQAINARAKQFLLISSMGASIESNMFYTQVKGQIEEALKELDFPALHIFRPSLLLGERASHDKRLAEGLGQAIMPILNILMVGPWVNYRAIKAQTVANAMVAAALNNENGTKTYHHMDIQRLGR